MTTLLEKAKGITVARRDNKLSNEELELVAAWLDGDVTLTQIVKVTKWPSSKAYVTLALGARELAHRGKMK